MLRRVVTTAMIALGPSNPAVLFPISRKCRQFGATVTYTGDYLRLRKDKREMRLALSHFVYAPYMAENFDLYFSLLVPQSVDGFAMLDYSRAGALQTYTQSGLQFELASFPEEEDSIESYFDWYRPKAGDTVFDIGAHCGVSTYHFSQMVGEGGSVIAFEPDPVSYSLLLRNMERHSLSNVTALQIAVAGTDGQAEFSCEETLGSGLMRHLTRSSTGTVLKVETVTLASAFGKWGQPQFCKIDIEGAELEVISAAQAFLTTTRCEFALDTNHRIYGAYTDKRIERLFHASGYDAATSAVGIKTTWARPQRPLGASA